MTSPIYLMAVDNTGAVVPGPTTLAQPLRNPLRGNLATTQPIVLDTYGFNVDLTTGTGTGGTQVGAFTVGEIQVTMMEDSTTATFFRACYRATTFRSIDVLLTKPSGGQTSESVWYGIGVSNALVSSMGFSGSTADDNPRRSMTFTGRVFTVGTTLQRPDGTLVWSISTYDVTRNTGT